jgi:hypothetical protein
MDLGALFAIYAKLGPVPPAAASGGTKYSPCSRLIEARFACAGAADVRSAEHHSAVMLCLKPNALFVPGLLWLQRSPKPLLR